MNKMSDSDDDYPRCGCCDKYCNKCGNYYRGSNCPICERADGVMRGDYDNGERRKELLGEVYGAVQNEVNRRLGISKRHPI